MLRLRPATSRRLQVRRQAVDREGDRHRAVCPLPARGLARLRGNAGVPALLPARDHHGRCSGPGFAGQRAGSEGMEGKRLVADGRPVPPREAQARPLSRDAVSPPPSCPLSLRGEYLRPDGVPLPGDDGGEEQMALEDAPAASRLASGQDYHPLRVHEAGDRGAVARRDAQDRGGSRGALPFR